MSRLLGRLGALFRWVLQPLLVIAVLMLGFWGAMGLSSAREEPARQEQESYAPLVRVVPVSPGTLAVVVSGNGSLQARTRIDLIPQVGGKVVELHPALRAGGRFAAGEVLARIERIDFELGLAQAGAEVSSASTALEIQRAEADAARDEWGRINPDQALPTLVGREPQIQEAEARLAAARARYAAAELDLSRTELTLPFDGRVIAASIDVGQVLAPNQPIGSVYATSVFEVPVPLEVDELSWVRLAGDEPGEPGSAARVRARLGAQEIDLEGRAVRLEGELDGTSRLARVIVEVTTEGLAPSVATRILPGLFVDVQIDGGVLHDVVALPREAVRESGTVWTVVGGRIEFVTPRVLRATEASLFVTGIAAGTLIVTSNLEVVTDGMQVRVLAEAAP
jgi:RND family efflux transporter MFP subunit